MKLQDGHHRHQGRLTSSPGSDHQKQGNESGQAGEKSSKHGRDDVFEKRCSPISQAEKEALKIHPELKNRQLKDPRPFDPAIAVAKKSEADKRDEKLDAQSVPNSVFGSDRVTLSPEAQVVPAITRKSEAVGVKRNRQKYLPPGLNGLAKKANPAPTFQQFLGALTENFS